MIEEATFAAPNILALVDDASLQIRKWMGLTASQLEQSVDLAISDFSTDNLEAIRHLVLAESGTQPLYHFDRALELDSAFVMAAVAKARWLHTFQYSDIEAQRTIALAMRYRERLPLEWELTVRSLYFRLHDQLPEAVEVLRMQLELDPQNVDLLDQLAQIYWTTGQTAELPDISERIFRIDPTAERDINVVKAWLVNEQVDEASERIDQFVKRYPRNVRGLHMQAICRIHQGRLDDAAAAIDAMQLHQPEVREDIRLLAEAVAFMQTGQHAGIDLHGLIGHYRHEDLQMNLYVQKYNNQLHARAENQRGYFLFPVSHSTFVMGNAAHEHDRWQFVTDSLGRTVRAEVAESNYGRVTGYTLWKQDSVIQSAESMAYARNFGQARDLLAAAIDSHPEHFYLRTLKQHVDYMLDHPDAIKRHRDVVGTYGPRRIWIEQDRIFYKRTGWAMRELLPISDHRYAMPITYNYLIEAVHQDGVLSGTVSWFYDKESGRFIRDEADFIARDQ